MDISFKDLVKYARMKNVNGSIIKELLKHKDLVHKIEDLRKEDPNLDEVVDKLQKCNFTKSELDSIKELYEKYFGLEEEMSEEEKLAEKFGVSLDKIDVVQIKYGEEVYRIINSDNRDIVLKKNKKDLSLEDELNEYSDSLNFDDDLDNNAEDAAEYQRIHGYNELKFYTKEEINRKPEILDGLTIDQIEEVRALIKMENVVFINVEYGLGIGAKHQIIHAEYNSFKGTLNVSNSDNEKVDILEEEEELDLYGENKNVAPEREYADLVSTTELPVIDDQMLGYYENHEEELNELEDNKRKVYKRKIMSESTGSRGYVGYAILIGIVAIIGVVVAVIKLV